MEQETLVYPLADNTVLQDKYTILSVLNAGGFGITYLALDNPGSRYVVIKECMPDAYACRELETLWEKLTAVCSFRGWTTPVSISRQA